MHNLLILFLLDELEVALRSVGKWPVMAAVLLELINHRRSILFSFSNASHGGKTVAGIRESER